MEIHFNSHTEKHFMILTNADNETVHVYDRKTFLELVSIAGIEKVEIYYERGGWCFLENEVKSMMSEPLTDENENEALDYFWDQFELAVDHHTA